ncbi:MAG TPA: ribonuclease J [Candidatus Borkfalkia excrementigallinarum]|uniref:Ribonuclease J n=1 Tax=Candidatus Borkfalkia excrementigallinarum TaxID=2838506 RepID=A0A9D1ZVU2_9FIRM|nr:ribonuclease J [Candidatus Borkfalkia excrementigallinarum]
MKQKQNDRTVTKENGQAAQPKRRADMPLFLGNAKDAANRQNAAQKAQVRREGAAAERAEARSAGREEKREQKQPFAPNGKQKKFSKKGRGRNPVKIMFLGGVGEIGKNMTAIEYGNDIIIIDAGLTFPDEELPGIDLVIPDISYLVANKNKIRGLLITHGHEDHVGGIPYLLKEIDMPVYATKLTLALADNKLREHRLNKVQMNTVRPGDRVKLGCFTVEFINVNHSIAGAVALCIDTPNGRIFHSGDFKIDLTPVAGEPIDLSRIAEIGREGVKLLLCESTNVERQGYTMSETVVGTTLDHLFSENVNRRIIVATFASNVHRLQQIVDLAAKYRRKVALSGRSMLNVVDAATKIGELTIPEGVLIDVEKIKNYFDREIVIVSTGSQGEPMSALTRMASGEFNKVTIGSNDTIIISASPIPGNEKMIYRVINNLYRKGANVVYESLEKIHVSGHACQEELKILHSLLDPEYFIPVHGEYRHLKRHAQLAVELGMSENKILIADIGNCVELTKDNMQFGESISSGSRLVDGSSLEGKENSVVMKDRKHLSEDGIFVITACVSERTGDLLSEPAVVNRGFVMPENADYASEISRIAVNLANQVDIAGDTDNTEYAAAIKKAVKNFIYKKTKQNPVVMANIVRI